MKFEENEGTTYIIPLEDLKKYKIQVAAKNSSFHPKVGIMGSGTSCIIICFN